MTDRPRLPALTSVRFLAALHVCLFHVYAMRIAGDTGWLHKVASIGDVGVNFFFIPSGFILVYTYADRGTLACSSYAPTGQVRVAEGGYRVSGRWSFSSLFAFCLLFFGLFSVSASSVVASGGDGEWRVAGD